MLDAFQSNAYDEVGLIREPIPYGSKANPNPLKVAGKVSLYYYKLPDGRSLLEVQRNYEASLKAKGFQLKFSCATTDGSCYRKDPDRETPYIDVSALAKAMESDKIVFVDATAMQKGLAESGRINLYGIHFDLDKDSIKPESQPTLVDPDRT